MRRYACGQPLGYITAFKRADYRSRGQSIPQPMRQLSVVLRLEGEAAKGISSHGIEAG
jgi:hypothetical protein